MSQINLGRILPVFCGEWDGQTQYSKLDVTYYDGSSYVAISDNLNKKPTENTDVWRLMAAGGHWATMTEEEKQEIIDELGTDLIDLSFEDGEHEYPTGKEVLLKTRDGNEYYFPMTNAYSVWDESENLHDILYDYGQQLDSLTSTTDDLDNRLTQLQNSFETEDAAINNKIDSTDSALRLLISDLSERIEDVNDNLNDAISTVYTTFNIQVTDGYVSNALLSSVQGTTITFEDGDGLTYSKVLDKTGYYCFALKGDTTYDVTIDFNGTTTKHETEDAETGVRRVNYSY